MYIRIIAANKKYKCRSLLSCIRCRKYGVSTTRHRHKTILFMTLDISRNVVFRMSRENNTNLKRIRVCCEM